MKCPILYRVDYICGEPTYTFDDRRPEHSSDLITMVSYKVLGEIWELQKQGPIIYARMGPDGNLFPAHAIAEAIELLEGQTPTSWTEAMVFQDRARFTPHQAEIQDGKSS